MVVARGNPLDFYESRYPDGRDVVLVVEIAVSSLAADLGPRLTRYATTLPSAAYIVADVPNRRILLHSEPRADGTYLRQVVTGPGERLLIQLDGLDIEPIAYEEVMR